MTKRPCYRSSLAIVAYKRSWREFLDMRDLQRKKKEQKKKEKFGRGDLLKLPQLRKSKKVAFGDFFLMISTSCLKKPTQKTLRLFHSYNKSDDD